MTIAQTDTPRPSRLTIPDAHRLIDRPTRIQLALLAFRLGITRRDGQMELPHE